MRNLLTLALALGLAGAVSAQNNATTNQTGTDNVANVEQVGQNTSNVDQNSVGAGAFVDQAGTGNASGITQSDSDLDQSIGAVPQDPEAFVTQNGQDNASTVTQSAVSGSRNLVTNVNQSGANNVSGVSQDAQGPGFTGTFRASATQTGDADSDISQTGAGQSARNLTARVTQDASTSQIDQSVDGTNSRQILAEVNQTGGSFSDIDQTVDADGVQDINAFVTQSNGASSTISQNAFGNDSNTMTATVNQDGMSSSMITQTYDNDLSNTFTVTVDQVGDMHSSTVTQRDLAGGSGGDSNLIADIDQSGSDNTSVLSQLNRSQNASVTQSGSGQDSDASQTGNRNSLDLDQSGLDNSSFSDQRGNGTATIAQTGEGNFSNVLQAGNFAKEANVTQDGNGSFVDIDQLGGRFDVATVEQGASADGASATIIQNGMGNTETRNMALIQQNLMGGGAGNTATVTQTGTGNSATTVQN
ncbi:Curlin associated protein [Rubrivirga sp.]|uniref:Curlin associated protein n=1 Tax=Rubrivirga sp. TaxID=1885344 RepID=UPI003C765DB0